MERKEARWAWAIFIMMLLAYIVPYVLLSGVNAWYGSFLFWTLFAFIVIVFNIFMTTDWSD